MSDGSLLVLGVEGPELSPEEAALFRRLQPAGYVLFSRNVVEPRQVRKLTDDLRGLSYDEPILAIDQEGGRVTRTKGIAPVCPSAVRMAERGDKALIADAGALTGDLLGLLGLNMDFAPVLDLDHFPGTGNALRGRCWGRDPQRVIDCAGQWNRWLRKHRIAGCAKHFPACGRARCDPHHELPVSDATIEELLAEDVIPYTALMPEIDAVMLAHVEFPKIDPDFPASLSRRMVTGFLREQLGFDRKLVLTDDLDMGAVTKRYGRGEDVKMAISAGNDLAMICHETKSAEVAAKAIGELSLWTRDDALARVDRFRRKVLKEPPAWSDERWERTCAELAELAGKFGAEEGPVANSPVEDY